MAVVLSIVAIIRVYLRQTIIAPDCFLSRVLVSYCDNFLCVVTSFRIQIHISHWYFGCGGPSSG